MKNNTLSNFYDELDSIMRENESLKRENNELKKMLNDFYVQNEISLNVFQKNMNEAMKCWAEIGKLIKK